jgi:hypothetical protein
MELELLGRTGCRLGVLLLNRRPELRLGDVNVVRHDVSPC